MWRDQVDLLNQLSIEESSHRSPEGQSFPSAAARHVLVDVLRGEAALDKHATRGSSRGCGFVSLASLTVSRSLWLSLCTQREREREREERRHSLFLSHSVSTCLHLPLSRSLCLSACLPACLPVCASPSPPLSLSLSLFSPLCLFVGFQGTAKGVVRIDGFEGSPVMATTEVPGCRTRSGGCLRHLGIVLQWR